MTGAQAGHGDGEHQRGLRARPTKLGLQGFHEYRPGVHDAQKQVQHEPCGAGNERSIGKASSSHCPPLFLFPSSLPHFASRKISRTPRKTGARKQGGETSGPRQGTSESSLEAMPA